MTLDSESQTVRAKVQAVLDPYDANIAHFSGVLWERFLIRGKIDLTTGRANVLLDESDPLQDREYVHVLWLRDTVRARMEAHCIREVVDSEVKLTHLKILLEAHFMDGKLALMTREPRLEAVASTLWVQDDENTDKFEGKTVGKDKIKNRLIGSFL